MVFFTYIKQPESKHLIWSGLGSWSQSQATQVTVQGYSLGGMPISFMSLYCRRKPTRLREIMKTWHKHWRIPTLEVWCNGYTQWATVLLHVTLRATLGSLYPSTETKDANSRWNFYSRELFNCFQYLEAFKCLMLFKPGTMETTAEFVLMCKNLHRNMGGIGGVVEKGRQMLTHLWGLPGQTTHSLNSLKPNKSK